MSTCQLVRTRSPFSIERSENDANPRTYTCLHLQGLGAYCRTVPSYTWKQLSYTWISVGKVPGKRLFPTADMPCVFLFNPENRWLVMRHDLISIRIHEARGPENLLK